MKWNGIVLGVCLETEKTSGLTINPEKYKHLQSHRGVAAFLNTHLPTHQPTLAGPVSVHLVVILLIVAQEV